MDLGDRITKFLGMRKISFDGESYHSRIPLEIVKTLEQYGIKLNGVQWEGIWKDENCFHLVLTIGEGQNSKEKKKNITTEDRDYVVLTG